MVIFIGEIEVIFILCTCIIFIFYKNALSRPIHTSISSYSIYISSFTSMTGNYIGLGKFIQYFIIIHSCNIAILLRRIQT